MFQYISKEFLWKMGSSLEKCVIEIEKVLDRDHVRDVTRGPHGVVSRTTAGSIRSQSTVRAKAQRPRPPQSAHGGHGHRPRKNALSFHSGLSERGGRKRRRRKHLSRTQKMAPSATSPLVVSLNLLKVPIRVTLVIRFEMRKRKVL